jgi:RNA polymerase sigma factor (sigma-70 family)
MVVAIVKLSPRELEVMRAVAEGKTNEEIANELGLQTETVKTHMKKAFRKLQASNRAHAVTILFRAGYIK